MGSKEGLSPLLAAGLAAGGVTAALLVGRRASPGPDHPRTQRWYRDLDKPAYTPPPPIYPIAWIGIQAAQAYSGYRLMRSAASPERAKALALWATNQIGIASW